MKKYRVIAFVISFLLFFIGFLNAEEDKRSDAAAVDLFIQACLHSGCNPNLIKTCGAEFDYFKKTDLTEEFCKDVIDFELENAKKIYSGPPEELEQHLQELEAKQRKSLEKTDHCKLRVKVRGLVSELTIDRVSNLSYFSMMDIDDPRLGYVTLQAGTSHPLNYNTEKYDNKKRCINISRVANSSFTVGQNASAAERDPRLFGRVFSYPIYSMLHTLFPDNKSLKKFYLKNNSAFNSYNKKKGRTFRIGEMIEYEPGSKATTLEVYQEGNLSERYLIDSDRGYICPRIEIYNSGQLINEFIAKEFFQEPVTGLWYPSFFSYRNPKTAHVSGNYKEFKLNKAAFSLNAPMSDQEFGVDLASGESIYDARLGTDIVFRAKQDGTLYLEKGDIDLYALDWLQCKGTGGQPMPESQKPYLLFRTCLITVGILCIVFALYQILRKKARQ